jgi:hypothetical protein
MKFLPHAKPDEVPTTHLASEAANARFEQVFVDVGDRFPTVGPPNKDTLGIPLPKETSHAHHPQALPRPGL